jgi:sugar (pentulose or hexulose) kinase
VVAEYERPVTLSSARPGWAEEDPQDWWANVLELVREAVAGAGSRPIAAVGVTGMVPALICLDAGGHPLRPAILQNDARADHEIAGLREELAGAGVLHRTGSPVTQQSVGPKLLWLRRHEPGVLARTASVCGSYDFVTAGADHVAGALAAGLVDDGDVVVELGGAGNILAATTEPVVDERLYLDHHLVPGGWVPNGCMATTGSLVRWFQREIGAGVPLAALDAEAADAGTGAGGLVLTPYFLGEKTRSTTRWRAESSSACIWATGAGTCSEPCSRVWRSRSGTTSMCCASTGSGRSG